MAFSSVQFLFIFLPLSLAVYWLLPKALRNGALGAFSLLFFAWAGLKGAAILLALAAITWLGGLLLEKLPRKKPLLILLIAAHLAVLAAFKYAGFAARSINALVPDLLPVFAPALPLGVSFYVFTAIGIGSFFGLELPENFNYPYLSCSVGEYWRRWHISLSGWFRDYVYIPLGGSRCSLAKNCRNLLIVFLLTGLWHGAAWQYVAFGLLHGVLLCLERLGLRKFLQCIPPFFAHAYTLVVLWFTLIIFGAHGLAEGLAAWKGILSWQSGAQGYTAAAFADTKLMVLLAASLLLCGPLQACFPRLKKALYAKEAPGLPGMVGLLVLLFLSLMRVTAGTYSAFIYFQF